MKVFVFFWGGGGGVRHDVPRLTMFVMSAAHIFNKSVRKHDGRNEKERNYQHKNLELEAARCYV